MGEDVFNKTLLAPTAPNIENNTNTMLADPTITPNTKTNKQNTNNALQQPLTKWFQSTSTKKQANEQATSDNDNIINKSTSLRNNTYGLNMLNKVQQSNNSASNMDINKMEILGPTKSNNNNNINKLTSIMLSTINNKTNNITTAHTTLQLYNDNTQGNKSNNEDPSVESDKDSKPKAINTTSPATNTSNSENNNEVSSMEYTNRRN
jgi:hypothetical protein